MTRALEENAKQGDIQGLVRETASLLDENSGSDLQPEPYPTSGHPEIHFSYIKETIDSALVYRDRAFSKLGEEDRQFLAAQIPALVAGLMAASSAGESGETSEMQPALKVMQLAHDIDYAARTRELVAGEREWIWSQLSRVPTITPVRSEANFLNV